MIVDPENGPMIGTVRGCCSDGASCSCWESMSGGMIVPMTLSLLLFIIYRKLAFATLLMLLLLLLLPLLSLLLTQADFDKNYALL